LDATQVTAPPALPAATAADHDHDHADDHDADGDHEARAASAPTSALASTGAGARWSVLLAGLAFVVGGLGLAAGATPHRSRSRLRGT
jgi:hypothetical protein